MSSFLIIPSKKIKDLEQLKAAIIKEVQIIAADTVLLKKVCSSVTGRAKECIDADGGHFEKNR